MTYQNFALIMKIKRERKGYLQKDMASFILVSESKYSRMENGFMEPTFEELQLICKILDIDFNIIIQTANFKDYLLFD